MISAFIKKSGLLSVFFIVFFAAATVFVVRAQAEDWEQADGADFRVSGVIFDRQEPMAIVNDALVKEGEEVNGAKVLKISDSTVRFSYKGKIFVKDVGQGCAGIAAGAPAAVKSDHGRACRIMDPEALKKMQEMIPLAWIAFFLMILLYIYAAVCLQKIAIKTNTEYSWLAWIPIANLYLMYLIAKPAIWWFILLFIPYANIVAMAFIWMGIAEARKKPKWLGLLMLLPVANLVVMGYLAFSK